MLFTFAKKYLRTQNKAINIIAWISVSAIAVGTAALLVVLSGFNGLDGFIRGLYGDFYSDVKIKKENNQLFEVSENLQNAIVNNKTVNYFAKTLEENVLLTNGSMQSIVTLKGVDENYIKMTHFNTHVVYGDTQIFVKEPRILVGMGIANSMQLSEQNLSPVGILAFSKDSGATLNQESYSDASFYISGLYTLQEEIDGKYCITSLQHMQQVVQAGNAVNALELMFVSDKAAEKFIVANKNIIESNGLIAQTKYEQNKTLYYILKSEKWFTYAIMSFMLLIASFNLIGSLSMLVLEKTKDISILKAMGSSRQMVRNIFMSTGIYIGMLGASIGIGMALILCFLQAKYKLVKLGGSDNFLLDAYPVKVVFTDFLLVLFTVFIISAIASWLPASKAAKR